jgi:hypothetical protein
MANADKIHKPYPDYISGLFRQSLCSGLLQAKTFQLQSQEEI